MAIETSEALALLGQQIWISGDHPEQRTVQAVVFDADGGVQVNLGGRVVPLRRIAETREEALRIFLETKGANILKYVDQARKTFSDGKFVDTFMKAYNEFVAKYPTAQAALEDRRGFEDTIDLAIKTWKDLIYQQGLLEIAERNAAAVNRIKLNVPLEGDDSERA